MNWKIQCVNALDEEKMFETPGHRTRFKELVDCFSGYPFFTKGLCKCIYLSAWDDEHFCIMLETLTDLSLGRETNTREMEVKGEALAEDEDYSGYCVYTLSNAFLMNQPFTISVDSPQITPEIRYILRRALQAAEVIDNIPDLF